MDFKFTAYKTLAFTKDDGMLEFVKDSHTIQDIIQKHSRGIEQFLKSKCMVEHVQIVGNKEERQSVLD